jgi:chromosomal replication initiator protein
MDALPDLTCESIQRAVADTFGVSVEDLVGPGRPQSIAEPRQIAMYLCRRMTRLSLQAIGASFARNHATVVHACKAVRAACATDPEYKTRIDGVVRKFGRDPSVVLED